MSGPSILCHRPVCLLLARHHADCRMLISRVGGWGTKEAGRAEREGLAGQAVWSEHHQGKRPGPHKKTKSNYPHREPVGNGTYRCGDDCCCPRGLGQYTETPTTKYQPAARRDSSTTGASPTKCSGTSRDNKCPSFIRPRWDFTSADPLLDGQ